MRDREEARVPGKDAPRRAGRRLVPVEGVPCPVQKVGAAGKEIV
jgi:hypothetical protein